MMPTQRTVTLTELGALAADRERLLTMIFAIEAQLAAGAVDTDWRELLKAATWIRERDPQREA